MNFNKRSSAPKRTISVSLLFLGLVSAHCIFTPTAQSVAPDSELAFNTEASPLSGKAEAAATVAEFQEFDYRTDTPNEWKVPTRAGLYALAVRKSWETGHAALYINNKEVVRFRNKGNAESTQARAHRVATQLLQFLAQGGTPRDIKPGLAGREIVIRAGQKTLVTVDQASAQAQKITEQVLALQWVNQLRTAFGVPAIDRANDKLASRGFVWTADRIARPTEITTTQPVSIKQAATQLAPKKCVISPKLPSHVTPTGKVFTGLASWYGPGFHGRRSADGSRFDMNEKTAAHRFLPFGTLLRVVNLKTGKQCIVKVTDRGPYGHERIVDLSKGAAKEIGLTRSGISTVSIQVVQPKPDVATKDL